MRGVSRSGPIAPQDTFDHAPPEQRSESWSTAIDFTRKERRAPVTEHRPRTNIRGRRPKIYEGVGPKVDSPGDAACGASHKEPAASEDRRLGHHYGNGHCRKERTRDWGCCATRRGYRAGRKIGGAAYAAPTGEDRFFSFAEANVFWRETGRFSTAAASTQLSRSCVGAVRTQQDEAGWPSLFWKRPRRRHQRQDPPRLHISARIYHAMELRKERNLSYHLRAICPPFGRCSPTISHELTTWSAPWRTLPVKRESAGLLANGGLVKPVDRGDKERKTASGLASRFDLEVAC
jgi:hypothetical protein